MNRSDDDAPSVTDRNLKAILESPTYVLAQEDIEFLKRDELRPVRLQLEYLKPELILQQHRIRSTIVVFGGTRILQEETARIRVESLRKELEQNPESRDLKDKLAVAERVLAKSKYYDEARALARIVSERCQRTDRREMVIVTGGGPGVMEAANRGAYDVGAKSIGLNITLPHEQAPNPYISPDLCFEFHYFALRKMHFLLRARALVAFPGGMGTMDELFEALTLLQTRTIEPLPVILVGREFWEGAVNLRFFVEEGTISPEDLSLFQYAETGEEIWRTICAFHQMDPERPLN